MVVSHTAFRCDRCRLFMHILRKHSELSLLSAGFGDQQGAGWHSAADSPGEGRRGKRNPFL